MKKLALGLIVAVPLALLAWTAHLILSAPATDWNQNPTDAQIQAAAALRDHLYRAGGLHHHMGHPAGLSGMAVCEMAGAKAVSEARRRSGPSGQISFAQISFAQMCFDLTHFVGEISAPFRVFPLDFRSIAPKSPSRNSTFSAAPRPCCIGYFSRPADDS